MKKPIFALVIALVSSGMVAALSPTGIQADVAAINYKGGTTSIDIVITIPHGVDNAARKGGAPFSIQGTLTYVSTDNTVETLNWGPFDIAITGLLSQDSTIDFIKVTQSFGTLPPPSQNPSFSSTAAILVN